MDLIAMAQTVRRHKFATLPVILLTLVLGIYVVFLTAPEYQASGSYILVSPPPPPTQEQIAHNPALGKLVTNNPLTSYGNLQVVGLMLSQQMGNRSEVEPLLHNGVDPRSTVVNNTIYSNAPLLAVTGVGSTPAVAVRSGMLEGQALVKLLDNIQIEMGVSPGYRVTAYPLVTPDQAGLKTSSKLRNLIVVMVVGIVLLFVAVSIGQAWEDRKRKRADGGVISPGASGLPVGVADQMDLVSTANIVGTANGRRHVAPRFAVRDGTRSGSERMAPSDAGPAPRLSDPVKVSD
jgi:hypothetical protein